ncbi:hypothetical protein OROGR_026796 [Orobanche gracilis]
MLEMTLSMSSFFMGSKGLFISSKLTKITSTMANGKSPTAPAVKFSDDTKQLQYINSIRKAPVGAQIKRVIGLLFETREAFTPEQINEEIYVDINSNKSVFDSLRNNPKVRYDGTRFSYKDLQYKPDIQKGKYPTILKQINNFIVA